MNTMNYKIDNILTIRIQNIYFINNREHNELFNYYKFLSQSHQQISRVSNVQKHRIYPTNRV